MESIILLILALILDLLLGEPPNAAHPVAWIGKVISWLIRVGKGRSPIFQMIYGTIAALLTLGIFVTPVYFLLSYLKEINLIAYIVFAALLFKISFSLRGLQQAALMIKRLLMENKLSETRFELRALVGRDTRSLDKSFLVSATVESVAENICDSFFAPLFYFVFFGVPGAIAYRVINTMDAMIGHHGEFEYLGKFSARLDTIANYVPARIAALMIVLSSWICRKNVSSAWRVMLRDHRNTASPNAGWTMSAMAGALDVQVEKIGYYKLGDSNALLSTSTIDESVRIILVSSLIWSLVIILAEVIYHVVT